MSSPHSCGCRVVNTWDFIEKENHEEILYCATHAAAPDMLKALTRLTLAPALNLDDLEEEDHAARAEAIAVIAKCIRQEA